MLNHSSANLIFIRICILLLQYTPLIYAVLICILLVAQHAGLDHPLFPTAISTLSALLLAEAIFYLTIYRPHLRRIRLAADHPAPLTPAARAALFAKCAANIRDAEAYLQLWHLGAPASEIRRDNVREFFQWAFYDGTPVAETGEDAAELDAALARTEELLGRPLKPGRGNAESLRLTVDAVQQRYHGLPWYVLVGLVDGLTAMSLRRAGLQYHGGSAWSSIGAAFPPRLLPTWGRSASPSRRLAYWFRPHGAAAAAAGLKPVVFVHGIGVGLLPYQDFLRELAGADGDDVGIIALEVLPMSSRLTAPLLPRETFLRELRAVLAHYGPAWDEFVMVSHSYGSVLTTHALRDPNLGPRIAGVVLVDPVSILLHLPDVAYNFTRRPPRTANEWQLWYFASMDLGVAEGLGRHFFWRENLIWREELLARPPRSVLAEGNPIHDKVEAAMVTRDVEVESEEEDVADEREALLRVDKRKSRRSQGDRKAGAHDIAPTTRPVAVYLSGRDLIVETRSVAQYLANEKEFGDLDDDELSKINDQLDGEPGCKSGVARYRKVTAPSKIELFWYPNLDHAQIFDIREDREPLLEAIRRFCAGNGLEAREGDRKDDREEGTEEEQG